MLRVVGNVLENGKIEEKRVVNQINSLEVVPLADKKRIKDMVHVEVQNIYFENKKDV